MELNTLNMVQVALEENKDWLGTIVGCSHLIVDIDDGQKEYLVSFELYNKIKESDRFIKCYDKTQTIIQVRRFEHSVFDGGGFDDEETVIQCVTNYEDEDAFFYLHALKMKNEKTNNSIEDVDYDIEDLSISMNDIGGHMCLQYFIDKHFNPNNEFNKNRVDEHFDFQNRGNNYCSGFIYNFFTLEEFGKLLDDVKFFYNAIKEVKSKSDMKNLETLFSPYLIDNVFYNGLYSFNLILEFYEKFIRFAGNILKNKNRVDVVAFCEC